MTWDRLKVERDAQILARLGKGESLRSIGRDSGMSHEAIRYIRNTKGEKQVSEIPATTTITVEDLWSNWERSVERFEDVGYLRTVVADIILYLNQQRKGEKQMNNEISKAEKGMSGVAMAPVTRCKVRVLNVTDQNNMDGKVAEQINIGAVYSDDPESENRQWSLMTPVFNLSMTINNPGAFGRLKAGMEYYVDFTPVAD